MALHDRDILRTMAFGIAGLSVVPTASARSSTERSVSPRCDDRLVVDYQNEGNKATPQFGNNDDRVDQIASEHRHQLHGEDTQTPDLSQRDAHPKRAHHHFERGVRQGYGKYSRWPPEGRAVRAGANPMHGRDSHGWLASCLSVAKLPYKDAQDGISYTVSIAPQKGASVRRPASG
jgi:formate C-acetyltransferase